MSAVPDPYLEPWMRGTHREKDALGRAVIHALELTLEDVDRKIADLNDGEIFATPCELPPVAFHLRHIARSLDRLLTYAEGRMLDESQLAALGTERTSGSAAEVLLEFRSGTRQAITRISRFGPDTYEETRGIGRKQLPTTVGGLLVHCAEHTQRHAGQAVTTAKIVRALAKI